MPSFGTELLKAANAYSDALSHDVTLPVEFEQAFQQLMATHNLLPDEDFEDPQQTEAWLLRVFESSYRGAHRLGGSFTWQNRGRCHGKMEAAARTWIQTTPSKTIIALIPAAGNVEQHGHAPVDTVTSKDEVKINFSAVKNAVMAHVHEAKQAPKRKQPPNILAPAAPSFIPPTNASPSSERVLVGAGSTS